MIIDFRVRPPFKGFTELAWYKPESKTPAKGFDPSWYKTAPKDIDPATVFPLHMGREPSPSYEQQSMPEFMKEMDAARIDLAVVMGRFAAGAQNVENDDLADLVKTYPGRFVGFGSVNSHDVPAALAELSQIVDMGLRGISLDNPRCDPPLYDDDERLFPIYERIQSLGLILSLTSSIFIGPDLTYSMPVHIQRVAQAFPKLPIVVPHASWPWTTQICAVAFKCPNVYLLPDFYMHLPHMPGANDYIESANYFLSYRMLYGSSYPVRPLIQSLRQATELKFASEEIRQRVLGGNAQRLLGL